LSELSFNSEFSDFGSLEIDSDSPVDDVFSSEEDIHKNRKGSSVIHSNQSTNRNSLSKSQDSEDIKRLISNLTTLNLKLNYGPLVTEQYKTSS